jgi:hypothetical protein
MSDTAPRSPAEKPPVVPDGGGQLLAFIPFHKYPQSLSYHPKFLEGHKDLSYPAKHGLKKRKQE